MPDDLEAAVHELERAVQLDPKTPHAHYFLGLARLSLNEWKPTPEAKAELHKEAENYPHDFLANYMLGFIASEERQYEDVRQVPENRGRSRSDVARTVALHGPECLRAGRHEAR